MRSEHKATQYHTARDWRKCSQDSHRVSNMPSGSEGHSEQEQSKIRCIEKPDMGMEVSRVSYAPEVSIVS